MIPVGDEVFILEGGHWLHAEDIAYPLQYKQMMCMVGQELDLVVVTNAGGKYYHARVRSSLSTTQHKVTTFASEGVIKLMNSVLRAGYLPIIQVVSWWSF